MRFVTLNDLIADHVRDGQTLAMEGFTHLIPYAAGHEIIRQGRRGLHLVRMTPDLIYDRGEFGKEPMIRILGPTPMAVAEKALALKNALAVAGKL